MGLKKRQQKSLIQNGTTYQREYWDKGYSRADTHHPVDQKLFLHGQCSSITEYRNAFVKNKIPPKIIRDRKQTNFLKQMGSGAGPVSQQSSYQQEFLPIHLFPRDVGLLQRKHVNYDGSLFERNNQRVGAIDYSTTYKEEYLNPHRYTFNWPALKVINPTKIRIGSLMNSVQPAKSIYQSEFHVYPGPLKINTRYGMRIIPDSHIHPKGDINFDTCYKLAYKDRTKVPISRRYMF